MGLFDIFRRRNRAGNGRPRGLGDYNTDFEEGEGGPSIYLIETNNLRWVAGQEALNYARNPASMDPMRFAGGRMDFNYERELADDHQVLRHQLANYAGARIRDDIRDLYELAGEVAISREELETADRALLVALRDWKRKREEIVEDELELDRYYTKKADPVTYLKFAVGAIFVLSEFIISGIVFEDLFRSLLPGFGYLLALGVTLVFIVLPHFVALGLKRGATQYHLSKQNALEESDEPIPIEIRRAVHVEEQDDKGFRIASIGTGITLLILMLPLSWIRAKDTNSEIPLWVMFFFMLALQLAISGYFFLREWLDYGHISDGLARHTDAKDAAEKKRMGSFAAWNDSVAAFREAAEDLVFDLEQIPHWDAELVRTYSGTLSSGRKILQLEHAQFEAFIAEATRPPLPGNDDVSMYGDRWLIERVAEGVTVARGEVPADDASDERAEDREADDTIRTWLDSKDPWLLLRRWMPEVGDRPFTYTRPEELDYLAADTPDEEPKSNEDEESSPTSDDSGGRPLNIVPTADGPDSASGGSTPN